MSGVEIEGLTPAFGGDEVVVDAATGGSRPRRRTLAVLSAIAVLALVVAVTRGGGSATTAATTTAATEPGSDDATTSSTVAPTTTTSADDASTTTTTIVRHDIVIDGGITVTTSTLATNQPRALREPSGLTVVSAGRPFARFDDLDTGLRTSVLVVSAEPGIGATNTTGFPGGVIIVLGSVAAPPGDERSIFVYANGAVRAPPELGGLVTGFVGPANARSGVQAWFTDRKDAHRVHLVDVAAGTVVRSVDLPPVATPYAGGSVASLQLIDPAGQLYDLAEDGTIVKHAGTATATPTPPATRHTEKRCDDALTACVVDWIDEDGTRTPLLDADQALTTSAVIAPAGPRLAAFIPFRSCVRGCDQDPGTGATFTVRDLDRQTSYDLGTTTAVAYDYGGFDPGSPLIWSTDGRWLFFPQITTDGRGVTAAWRPGLLAPVEITDEATAQVLGGNRQNIVFPSDTVMPLPTG